MVSVEECQWKHSACARWKGSDRFNASGGEAEKGGTQVDEVSFPLLLLLLDIFHSFDALLLAYSRLAAAPHVKPAGTLVTPITVVVMGCQSKLLLHLLLRGVKGDSERKRKGRTFSFSLSLLPSFFPPRLEIFSLSFIIQPSKMISMYIRNALVIMMSFLGHLRVSIHSLCANV